jgi:hypothetical protein
VVRLCPSYRLDERTSPKIRRAFALAREREEQINLGVRQQQLDADRSALRLIRGLPTTATGGEPLAIAVELVDAELRVQRARVLFRRQSEPDFASLPLRLDPQGRWVGSVPADVTSNQAGLVLEAVLEVMTANGVALSEGHQSAPRAISVSAGLISRRRFLPSAVFWGQAIGAGAALIGGAVSSGVSVQAQANYRNLQRSLVDAQALAVQKELGTNSFSASITLFAVGVGLAVTALITTFFVRW